jgi:hypothetical protein
MKNQLFLFVLLLFTWPLQGFRFEQANTQNIEVPPINGRLSIVYVEGSSPGLSIKVRNHLEDKIDSIADNPFLLYVSNSMVDENRKSEYYTKSKSSIQKRLSKLDDETLPNPDLRGDKRFILDAIANEDFSKLTEVDLHYYFTESYLKESILKETAACSFLNFLPAEICTMSSKAIVTVNIYVSDNDPKKLAEIKASLKQKVMFKNDGMFELNNLRCNIVEL